MSSSFIYNHNIAVFKKDLTVGTGGNRLVREVASGRDLSVWAYDRWGWRDGFSIRDLSVWSSSTSFSGRRLPTVIITGAGMKLGD
jgi:hypothetical protein